MPPANFTLIPLSATSIKSIWNEVPQSQQNSNIEGYILFYKETQLRSEPYTSLATEHLNVTVLGLKLYTDYTFRLLAYNRNGNGIATRERHVTTQESGNFSRRGTGNNFLSYCHIIINFDYVSPFFYQKR